MRVINVASCQPDETIERGAFRTRAFDLTERLGASVIGASVYEMLAGEKRGPYHYHHGFEEWLYVVSGSPTLRDPSGERTLAPGELVAFWSGPAGAHTAHGPGRVVMFSAGARGWGEAFVSVYPDSDKIAAAPGVMFRRGDAIGTWSSATSECPATNRDRSPTPEARCPTVNIMTASPRLLPTGHADLRASPLGPELGAREWGATLYELEPGETTAAYQYKWCREEWALVLTGAPTLRHADGYTPLTPGDICCLPQGPAGAHQVRNDTGEPARLIVFSTSTARPMSTFYPDEGTVLIQFSDREGLLFRHDDRIEDYWEGEPGAG